jgi:hypothetical protein
VQVRGLLTRDELNRYNALIEAGTQLERAKAFDEAYAIQQEVDRLIQPAIERLKEKSRQRDRDTEAYLREKADEQ